jgi:hypothetical protein
MSKQDEIEGRADALPACVNDLLVALNFISKLGYPGSVRDLIALLRPGEEYTESRASLEAEYEHLRANLAVYTAFAQPPERVS